MAKSTDRPLMRQKVRVSDALLKKWEFNFHFHNRQPINGSLMESGDIGKKFIHQERVFEIVGMGESDSIMLRETRDEGVFYWECTRRFAQLKLEKFNRAFEKLPNGMTRLVEIPYEEFQLLLDPKGRKRGKKKAEVEESEDEMDQFERIEDYEDILEDKTENDL